MSGWGRSAAHLRYISRESATVERERGVVCHNLPELLLRADGYEDLRVNLISYAAARETVERAMPAPPRGRARTHYRCTLSFERAVSTPQARALVREWLREAFPQARAVSFLHRDTRHLHAHVWLDARKTDGRKVHLCARAYRQLDERWNRIYCRALGRDEGEHLRKKEETREYRRARARGEGRAKPMRGLRGLRGIHGVARPARVVYILIQDEKSPLAESFLV